ncbi:MAG: SMP-30/gluconolactonase/LRE family protein [Massilia sp.]|jgi:gluconolactonase
MKPTYLAVLALAAGLAQAQDTIATAIPGVAAAGTRIELIREGFDGTEGPLALPDGSLIFTETTANRITRVKADGTTSTYLDNSNGSNGLGFGAGGALYAVQVREPRVGIVAPADKARTLADQWDGLPFGRPNDLVVGRNGNVYFTDSGAPPGARTNQHAHAVARPAVYRIPAAGKLERVAADIERPNGIQLSPDEKTLYVANTQGEHVLAYDVAPDGTVGKRRDFARLAGWSKGDNGWSSGADGLAVDGAGRLYVASNAGIEVFGPRGDALGVIALPKKPQNLAFAGPGKHTLYIVGRGAAYRIALLAQGYEGRAK